MEKSSNAVWISERDNPLVLCSAFRPDYIQRDMPKPEDFVEVLKHNFDEATLKQAKDNAETFYHPDKGYVKQESVVKPEGIRMVAPLAPGDSFECHVDELSLTIKPALQVFFQEALVPIFCDLLINNSLQG